MNKEKKCNTKGHNPTHPVNYPLTKCTGASGCIIEAGWSVSTHESFGCAKRKRRTQNEPNTPSNQ